jgi:hypothetical protein
MWGKPPRHSALLVAGFAETGYRLFTPGAVSAFRGVHLISDARQGSFLL